MLLSKTSLEKVLVERIQWTLAQVLEADFDYDVSVEQSYRAWAEHLVARVRAHFLSRELVDEAETTVIPDGPWDQIKFALNRYLGAFDAACRRRSIEPIGFRFQVKTRPVVVKRVYHVCPHLAKDHRDHHSWIFARPRDRPADLRMVHEIKPLVEHAIKNPHLAFEAIYRIHARIQETGAFQR